MWLGPVVALVPVTLRLLGIDWGQNAFAVIVTVLVSGLLVTVLYTFGFGVLNRRARPEVRLGLTHRRPSRESRPVRGRIEGS